MYLLQNMSPQDTRGADVVVPYEPVVRDRTTLLYLLCTRCSCLSLCMIGAACHM